MAAVNKLRKGAATFFIIAAEGSLNESEGCFYQV
jgi:hypothetical protein